MTDKLRDAAQQLPPFDDIRVQAVYKILTDDEMPEDKSEHWEGYQARRIVAALAQQDAQQKHKPLFAEMIAQHPGLAEELAQQDAQAVVRGWKLVPVEPTEAMCEEGLEDEGHTIRDGKAFADALYRAMLNAAPTPPAQSCWCQTCRPITIDDMRMVLCPTCGNKRCPHANDHRNPCTGSNEPGQTGSAYPSTTPPAPKPLGWLDRKAVECLQGPELNWMPAWNRPTSADPVPVFLGLPAQRVMLTDEEVLDLWSPGLRRPALGVKKVEAFARAVIEAYEQKNGLK